MLKFAKAKDEDYDTGYKSFVCGIYKIVRYGKCVDSMQRGWNQIYHAYYKPDGWKNWGNHVDKVTPGYKTLTEAKTACMNHATANS